jgi:ElaA protein
MKHEIKTFQRLSPRELFEIYKLRSSVFVVEQNCIYQDVDELDLTALHLMFWKGQELIGYSRLLPPDEDHKEPRIGRVVISRSNRGKGFGKYLMLKSILHIRELFPSQTIAISAQKYLDKFYREMGFTIEGGVYDEDGIPHIKMKLSS